MRLCGVLLTAAAIALVGIAATPRPAHACSCIHRELSEYADDITVAFVGRQLERVVHDQFDDNGAALLFRVDRVYKGEAGPLIEVRTHAQESRLRDRPRRHGRGRHRRQDVARRPVRQSVRLDGHGCRTPRRLRRGPAARRLDPPPGLGRRSRACSRSCSSQVPPRFSRPAQSHGTDNGRTGREALQTATGPDRRTSRTVPATAALPSFPCIGRCTS